MEKSIENFIFAISHNKLSAIKSFLTIHDADIRLDCISPYLIHGCNILKPYDYDYTSRIYKADQWFNITPLMYAGAFAALDSLKLLLELGADVTAEDSIGMTALTHAILGGSEKIALLLLDRGAPVTSATHKADPALKPDKKLSGNDYLICGITPLHLATRAGFKRLVVELLKKGADPLALDDTGCTPYESVIKEASVLADYELKLQNTVPEMLQKPGDALEQLDHLLLIGNKCDDQHQLIEAVLKDDYQHANMSSFQPTECQNMNLWKYGCMMQKSNALRYLVSRGLYSVAGDFQDSGAAGKTSPLTIAVRYNLPNLALLLINEKHYKPVQTDIADAACNIALLSTCLKYGLSLKPYEHDGRLINPLMANILPEDQDAARFALYGFMLKNGAVIEHTYNEKCVAVEAAAQNNARLLQMLKENGVNLDSGDKHGMTPLMKAACCGQMEALKYLISVMVNLDRQNDKGQTALFMAVSHSRVDVARRLVESGANPEIPDFSGTKPLTLAEESNLIDLQQLLMASRR